MTARMQTGQSIIGFLVTMMFMVVPMVLGINYVMRIGDAKHKTYEAARYAVWERTVWHQSDPNYNVKSDDDISWEINQRIFGKQNQALSSTEDRNPLAARRDVALDPLLYDWENTGGSRAEIIRRNGGYNRLNLPEENSPAKFSSRITKPMARYLRLEHRGFYSARVTVDLHKSRRLVDVFDAVLGAGQEFSTHSDNAMLIGAWNADGPDDVRQVVRRALPSAALDNSLMNIVVGSVGTLFPEIGNLRFGKVDPERVPCQRLTNLSGNHGQGC